MQGGPYPYANPSAMESASFNPRESESDLPLNPGESSQYQQWDNRGNAVGYAGGHREILSTSLLRDLKDPSSQTP